ncbi:hypothetical protein T492DRAFT_837419 [Pavlovales sp. CCMP2436]|nr:hypothetical protein T492DRAFT_837419 [Pavlovales sp. CCMP2436]
MIAAFLLLGLSLPEEQTIRLYSRPIELRPGQVHNRVDPPIQLPNGLSRSIAVTSFEVDVVEVTEDGRERSVPLYEGYNHHFITLLGSLEQMQRLYNHSAGQDPLGGECVKPSHDHGMLGTNGNRAHKQGYSQFGGASGAEFRNNPHDFPAPYAFVLRNVSHFLTVLHVINSKGFAPSKAAGSSTRLLECPCTPQRKIDVAAGTIDGCLPRPAFHCSDTLVAQGNGGCSLAAYTGGYRCCEDGTNTQR